METNYTIIDDVYKGNKSTTTSRMFLDVDGILVRTDVITDNGTSFKAVRTTAYSYDEFGITGEHVVDSERIEVCGQPES